MDSGPQEHDVVALLQDAAAHGLKRGQVGTIVHVHSDGLFEVEFSDDQGRMYALVSLRTAQVIVLRYRPSKVA